MSNPNDCWGIEVGANAIKAIHLVRSGNDIRVADYDILPFKKVLTTPDLNVDEAIQVNLDQFLSRHNIAKSTVMVSVPGHMAFARFAKLPPVDPKKIPDIVRFEAVQQIPFPIDQVEWDYQVFAQPDSPDVEVGIFAITKDRVMQFLSNYRLVGMHVDGITLSPLAVYNAFAYDLDLKSDSSGVIFMDIGTASTDVIIVENGQIWLRTLPLGGNNFTEALVRAFKLSFPKAEKLKREAATSKYARQIFQAMRPVFADLVQEMQRSLGYYQSLNRDAKITRLIGVGSTFRLPGMQKFLKQQLQMEVERPTGFKRVKVDGKQEADISENAMNLATAYGLAIQAMGLEAVNANLLPRHITRQRLWKAKQPWFAATAALMILSAGVAGLRLWVDEKAYEAKYTSTVKTISDVEHKARQLVNEWQSVEGGSDPRQEIENLRRILDFRDIWPCFLLDLDMAALALDPQPPLLDSDYDAIRAISRSERRRVYIDSITAEYQFIVDDAATAKAAIPKGAEGLTFEEVFGVRRPKEKNEPTRDQPAAAAVIGRAPPTFIITLKGTTPYSEGLKLIGDRYIKWLKDNAEREDHPRPYRLVVSNESLVSITPILDSESGHGGAPLAGNATGLRPRPRTGGMGASDMPSMGNLKDEPMALIAAPKDRLPKARDWRFELRWRIQLIRPEDARESESIEQKPVRPRRKPLTQQPAAQVEQREDQL